MKRWRIRYLHGDGSESLSDAFRSRKSAQRLARQVTRAGNRQWRLASEGKRAKLKIRFRTEEA